MIDEEEDATEEREVSAAWADEEEASHRDTM